MGKCAPGKGDREGIGLVTLLRMFPDDETARAWFEAQVWPDGPYCPHCGSLNVQSGIRHKTMTHRCRDCPNRPMFSLRTGTVMQGSNLGYQTWAIAIYLVTTGLKGDQQHEAAPGTSRSRRRRAWHLAHRIRKSFERDPEVFSGPVEADETYIGGLERNKHAKHRKHIGTGGVGKSVVVGLKDRDTNRVHARVVENTKKQTIQTFVGEHVAAGGTVYTDEAGAYKGLPYAHEAVRHTVGEYVRGMAHTNGMESFLEPAQARVRWGPTTS